MYKHHFVLLNIDKLERGKSLNVTQNVCFFQSHFQVCTTKILFTYIFTYIPVYNSVFHLYGHRLLYLATLLKQQTGFYPGYESHVNLSTEIENKSGKMKGVFPRRMKMALG